MPQDNRTNLEKLAAAHAALLKIHISGEESLAFAQALVDLTNVINDMQKEVSNNEVSGD